MYLIDVSPKTKLPTRYYTKCKGDKIYLFKEKEKIQEFNSEDEYWEFMKERDLFDWD